MIVAHTKYQFTGFIQEVKKFLHWLMMRKYYCILERIWSRRWELSAQDTLGSLFRREGGGFLWKTSKLYPHLSWETTSPALKLIKYCCLNVNISFLNAYSISPCPTHIPCRKDYPHNLTKYEGYLATNQFVWKAVSSDSVVSTTTLDM